MYANAFKLVLTAKTWKGLVHPLLYNIRVYFVFPNI